MPILSTQQGTSISIPIEEFKSGQRHLLMDANLAPASNAINPSLIIIDEGQQEIFKATLNVDQKVVSFENFMTQSSSELADLDPNEPVLIRLTLNAEEGLFAFKLNHQVEKFFQVSTAVSKFDITQVKLEGDLKVKFFGYVKTGN